MNERERYLSTTQGGYSKPAPAPVSLGTPNFSPPGQGGNNLPPVVDPTPDDTNARSKALLASSLASAAEADPYNILDAMTDLSSIKGQTFIPGPAGQSELTKHGKSYAGQTFIPDKVDTLGSLIAVDSSGNPILDSSGNPVFTSFGRSLHDDMQNQGLLDEGESGALEDYINAFSFDEIQDREKKFFRDSFDQSFYGMDDFDYNYYGGEGPTEISETFAGAPWSQKGLGEILAEGPKSLGEMEGMYDPEFRDREASFYYLTGIPQFRDQTIYDYV